MTSLNPVHKIGKQLEEAALLHNDMTKKEARARSIEMLERRRHPARHTARRRLSTPVLRRHAPARDDRDGSDQLAGSAHRRRADDGARRDDAGADPRRDQAAAGRVRYGADHDHARPRAWSPRPPTTSSSCTPPRSSSTPPCRTIFSRPRHPYTWGLMGSLPRLDVNVERLVQIPGQPPSLLRPAEGLPVQPALHVHDVRLSRDGAARSRAATDARGGVPPRCGNEGPRGGSAVRERSPAGWSYDDG